jgi:small subunit ribosomal protein S14
MISSQIKDKKIRLSFNKIEKLKRIKKFIFINLSSRCTIDSNISFNRDFLFHFFKKQQKMKMKNRARIVNRCVMNNRGRGVFRPFGVSRIVLRNLMQFGILPGYSKAVW